MSKLSVNNFASKNNNKFSNNSLNKPFELVVQLKDSQGKPTGRTKSFATDNPEKMDELWHRHGQVTKKKRKKAKAAIEPKDIKEGVEAANEYSKKINKNEDDS